VTAGVRKRAHHEALDPAADLDFVARRGAEIEAGAKSSESE
jgi:hypothetical protein